MRRDEREALACANYGVRVDDVPRKLRLHVHKACLAEVAAFCAHCGAILGWGEMEWRDWTPEFANERLERLYVEWRTVE